MTSAPDPPNLLSVRNVTHDSVTLQWVAGFDGGVKANYQIRYRKVHEDTYRYVDVPSNVTEYVINELMIDTPYVFSIMASNKLGSSKFLPDLTSARTSSKYLSILKV